MADFTPGPWGAEAYGGAKDDRWWQVLADDDALIASLGDAEQDRSEVASNARLIASAPDLLAACEAALPAMERALVVRQALMGNRPPLNGLGIAAVVELLKTAINKARGSAATPPPSPPSVP